MTVHSTNLTFVLRICFSTWNCTVCPFSVGITTLEAFFRAKPGWWWNVGRSKIHFYQMLITFPLFFYYGPYWGAGESWDFVIFRDFWFFTNFLNLVMHIGGPLSFRLVIFAFLLKSFNMPPTLGGQMIDTLPTTYLLSRSCLTLPGGVYLKDLNVT